MTLSTRSRLLGGAVLSAGLATLVPTQASAQCTIATTLNPSDTRACASTTTTDTTGFGPTDRNAQYSTATIPIFLNVNSGATVDGQGLAMTEVGTGAQALTVTNGGLVQVNVGNAPAQGGDGALQLNANGGTNVSYTGAGSVANLGTGNGLAINTVNGSISGTSGGTLSSVTGNGLNLSTSGTGGINFTSTGTISSTNLRAVQADVTAANGGDIVLVLNNTTNGNTGLNNVQAISASNTGNISVSTGGTTTGNGVFANLTSTSATGNIGLQNTGTTTGQLRIINEGTGASTIVNNGAMNSVNGIDIFQNNTAATGLVSVTGSGPLTSTGSDGIDIFNAGTGVTQVNYTGIIDATGGDGVQVDATNANAAAINVTTNVVRVSGGDGIDVSTAGAGLTTITANNGITGTTAGGLTNGILVDSTGTGGITVRQTSGGIGTTGNRATGVGISAAITNAASAGVIDIGTSAGTGINTVGDGINASTTGTGAVIVNAAGAIDTTGGDGIQATSTSGTLTITSGAITTTGGNGINAASTTGNQTINVNGNMTSSGIGVLSSATTGTMLVNVNGNITSTGVGLQLNGGSGPVTVNVGAGRTINSTGSFDVIINGTGLATVNNSGTIGATNTGVAIGNNTFVTPNDINNNAGGVINGIVDLGNLVDTIDNAGTWNTNGTNNLYDGNDVVTNLSGGVINMAGGNINFGAGADTFANSGTFNGTGTLEFGTGADVFNNNAGGIANFATGFVINNLETLNNAGTANVAGTLTFNAVPATVLNNSGILNLAAGAAIGGASLGATTNTGTINAGAGSSIAGSGAFTNSAGGLVDTAGAFTLSGYSSMTNNGVFDLAAGVLTVPAVPFTNGATGVIRADEGVSSITGLTSMANNGTIDLQDGATGDVFTVNAAYVGGASSRLQIDATSTLADQLIVNGGTSGSTFVDVNILSGTAVFSPILVVNDTSTTANVFTIGNVTGFTSPLVDYTITQIAEDYYLSSTFNEFAFSPLLVTRVVYDMWYQSADEVIAQTRLPNEAVGIGVWGQIYGSVDKSGENDQQVILGVPYDVRNKIETTRYGIQGGVDYNFGAGRIGLTAGLERAEANGTVDVKAKGWNAGIYGAFGGTLGFHGEALAKYDRYDVEFENIVEPDGSPDGRSWGVDGALGYRFAAGLVPIVDLNVGLSHVKSKIDDISVAGIGYDYDSMTSTRARGGVRAYFGGGWRPYLDATVYREFKGDGDVTLIDGINAYDLRSTGKATWVRVEGGLGGQLNRGPILAVWGEAGDRKGAGIRLGFRFGGSPVVETPPPPPPVVVEAPPAPPPPATQTCPDGSVILASDVCPPPPPPAPVEAAPERG